MTTSEIAGFIDYDASGRPFMGLVVTEGSVEVKLYLGHKDTAEQSAKVLGRELLRMAHDLQQTDNKIVLIEGVANDAAFRKPQG